MQRRCLAALSILSVLALASCGQEAFARWNSAYAGASAQVQAWFKNQHNAQGQWCCDESDGHPFFGAYTLNGDGSVTLETDGGLHWLPAYMVLKGANPTGHAVWWFTDAGGEHRDYCFAPGTLS